MVINNYLDGNKMGLRSGGSLPLGMKAAGFINSFVSVCSKKISLRLDKIGGQAATAKHVHILQATAERRHCNIIIHCCFKYFGHGWPVSYYHIKKRIVQQ